MNFVIDGVVPVIPTPFKEDEEIAWEDVDRLMDFAAQSRSCAVCLPAYASEFYKLSEHERLELVRRAVDGARGRLPVIAQVNSPSLKLAVDWAKMAIDCGVAAISTSVPRIFPLPEADIVAYFERLLSAVAAPFIIQDFNPGGATLSSAAIGEINRRCPNFRYVKLEDAMLTPRVRAIAEASAGSVRVLSGWGGMYIMELASAGIAGVMPSLGLADVLSVVLQLAREGRHNDAQHIFDRILPQIVFSLQNLELYHHAEKRLLRARRVLTNVHVRRAAISLGEADAARIDELNDRVLKLLSEKQLQAELNLPRVAG